MLSPNMRAALEAKSMIDESPRQQPAKAATTRLPFGADHPCPICAWPCSQLQYDEHMNLTGPLYEHRQHFRGSNEHVWPQLHTCQPSPDECPFCKDCPTC